MSMEEEKRAAAYPYFFFKIMIPELTDHHMRFPPKFLTEMISSEETGDKVTLKGPTGSIWTAKLSRTEDGTFIKQGWVEFVEDNGLGNHDCLLIRYWGSLCFEVEIFDKNGCKRTYAKKPKKRGRPPKKRGTQSKKVDINCSVTNVSHHFFKILLSDFGDRLRIPDACAEYMVQQSEELTGMTIPLYFAREHLPQHTTKIFLTDENERTREVKCYVRERQCCITSGWKNVVKDNDLHKGDHCVFELVSKDVMRIHIHRRYDGSSSSSSQGYS